MDIIYVHALDMIVLIINYYLLQLKYMLVNGVIITYSGINNGDEVGQGWTVLTVPSPSVSSSNGSSIRTYTIDLSSYRFCYIQFGPEAYSTIMFDLMVPISVHNLGREVYCIDNNDYRWQGVARITKTKIDITTYSKSSKISTNYLVISYLFAK